MITSDNLKAIFKIKHNERFYSDWAALLSGQLPLFDIKSEMRIASFIAQCAHESQEFMRLSENLNYSYAGLLSTFRKYFNEETAKSFAGKPELIANHVYANRNGNGSPESGDGYRYRGRGLIQITGKDNYRRAGEALNLNLIANPELLEHPINALRSSCAYWQKNSLNSLADSGDIEKLTRRINGGLNGLHDRMDYYERALDTLLAN